jgi:hypothetical protein
MIERCLESSFDLDPRRVAAQVPPELFRRHLGLPPDAELDEGSAALASAASAWYAANGLPWARSVVREVERIEGAPFAAARAGLRRVGSRRAREAEVRRGGRRLSAGKRVDARVDRRWKDQASQRRGDVPDAFAVRVRAQTGAARAVAMAARSAPWRCRGTLQAARLEPRRPGGARRGARRLRTEPRASVGRTRAAESAVAAVGLRAAVLHLL